MKLKMLGVFFVGAILASASVASADLVVANSFATTKVGQLPGLVIPANGDENSAQIIGSAPNFGVQFDANLFQATAVNITAPIVFSRISGISALSFTINNPVPGTFTASYGLNPPVTNPVANTNGMPSGSPDFLCPAGCVGGTAQLTGFANVHASLAGMPIPTPVPIPLNVIGQAGGQTVMTNALGGLLQITVTGAPWVTQTARITGLSTNVIQIPGRGVTGVGFTLSLTPNETFRTFTTGGGFIQDNPGGVPLQQATVSIAGTNMITPNGQAGTASSITPARVTTNLLGAMASAGIVTLEFAAPEPVETALLLAGAAGLSLLGFRRLRR